MAVTRHELGGTLLRTARRAACRRPRSPPRWRPLALATGAAGGALAGVLAISLVFAHMHAAAAAERARVAKAPAVCQAAAVVYNDFGAGGDTIDQDMANLEKAVDASGNATWKGIYQDLQRDLANDNDNFAYQDAQEFFEEDAGDGNCSSDGSYTPPGA